STVSQRWASSRRPLRISSHAAVSTVEIFQASSHFAFANGSPPSAAHWFMSDRPYRTCCACAAIVAPPLADRDASSAASFSSDRSSPMSPEFRMNALPSVRAPSTSSEKRFTSGGVMSVSTGALELVVFVGEQDVEAGQRAVAARDVALQLHLRIVGHVGGVDL